MTPAASAIARRRRFRRRLGAAGERCARALYRALGCAILCGNYRTRFGEIDLVVRDGACLVFVEVKTRRPGSRYDPRASWLGGQRRRLERSALDYLKRTELVKAPYRFELVEVVRSRFRLHHLHRHRVDKI